MLIEYIGQKCKVEFYKYENGNTAFKILDENGKVILHPTVDIGYKMNSEYVTLKDRDKLDTIGNDLKNSGVLLMKLDTINMEHGGALSLYMLSKEAREYIV